MYIFFRKAWRNGAPEGDCIHMKERFNIEIADIQFSIVSDEGEEFVHQIVETVDKRVRDLIINNKRCSKLDAVILCALDYCGEKQKADRKIKSLEAQVELLETNMRRLREESEAHAEDSAKEEPATDAPAPAKEEAPAEPAPAANTAPEAAAPANEDKKSAEASSEREHDAVQSKLRMIEELLGGKKN